MPKPLSTVKAANAMDDETLIKHVNARHTPIAGQTEFRHAFEGEKLMRQYHQHVHHNGFDDNDTERVVNHVHQAS